MQRVKKIFSADLVKVSFLNAIATFIKMLTGLVSNKIVAGIGADAIALLGQLNNLSTILLGISTGGINAGVTKYTAEHSGSPEKYNKFIGTGFWITIVLSVITGLVLIIGANFFSHTILHSNEYQLVFYVFGFTIVLYALNMLLISIMNGFKEFKKYVIANITASIVGLIFAVVLATLYNTIGALIGFVTYQSVVFFITLALVHRAPWFNWRVFTHQFSKSAALKLGNYSLMALVSAIVMPAAQMIVRNYITNHTLPGDAGLQEAGYWEGVNKLSTMYLLVVTTSLSVYYLPRLTELKTDYDLRKEVFSVYKLVIPFLILASIIIFAGRYLLIELLFTPEFRPMDKFFLYQLPGDLFKMSGWVLGYIMIARSMTRTYVTMELVSSSAQVLFSILFINLFGSIGGSIGYACGHLLYLLIMIVIFRKMFFSSKNAVA